MPSAPSRPDPVLRRAIAWLLALTVLFIFYASLYPFEFDLTRLRDVSSQGWVSRLGWRKPPRTDLIANLIFYIPFGIWVAYLTPRRWSSLRRGAFAVLTGASLSLLIECLQITTRTRDPSLADLTLNALSAGLGAALALSARGLGMRPVLPQLRAHRPDAVAMLLVIIWLALHAAPFMPTASFIWYLRQPSMLVDWNWTAAAIAGFFAGWALLGLALRSLLQPTSFWPVLAGVAALSLLARVVFRAQQLEINECLGLALAMPLIVAFQDPALRAALWIAPALVFFLLAPFGFGAPEPAFGWSSGLPIAHRTAAGEPGVLEVAFLYIGFVWLACEAGASLRRVLPPILVASALIEMAQGLQPGKSVDIWAPAAVLAGGVLMWLRAKLLSPTVST